MMLNSMFRGPLKCKDQKFRVCFHSKMLNWYNCGYHRTILCHEQDTGVTDPSLAPIRSPMDKFKISRKRAKSWSDCLDRMSFTSQTCAAARNTIWLQRTRDLNRFSPSSHLRLLRYAIYVGAQVLMHGAVLLAPH